MQITNQQCQILKAIGNEQSDCHSIIESTGLNEYVVRDSIEQLKNEDYIQATPYPDGIEPRTFYCGCQLTNRGHLELQNCK